MKLCLKCNKTEINDEEEFCETCKLEEIRRKNRERAEKITEETRRIRHKRNLIMGNNQRRH